MKLSFEIQQLLHFFFFGQYITGVAVFYIIVAARIMFQFVRPSGVLLFWNIDLSSEWKILFSLYIDIVLLRLMKSKQSFETFLNLSSFNFFSPFLFFCPRFIQHG